MTDSSFNAYRDRSVFVTGHTGFKGSWLTIWLNELGARVTGYSLDPPTEPSNFEASRLYEHIKDIRGDIRELSSLIEALEECKPEIVFHLAAQSNLLRSYREPELTFDTNVGGTVNVLEAIRSCDSVRAIVCITSDKCYVNREWVWGYRENDELGGKDPYSNSKAKAEDAISSYRHEHFSPERYGQHGVGIASVRAGNVIGGGDLAENRLVPDCMRALMAGEPITVRNPDSVRPWLYVLDCLSGYILLGEKLLSEGAEYSQAWNFGPLEQRGISTAKIAQRAVELWGSGSWEAEQAPDGKPETRTLRLNWDLAANRLGWEPMYGWKDGIAETVDWFKRYQNSENMYSVCVKHIAAYTRKAGQKKAVWLCETPGREEQGLMEIEGVRVVPLKRIADERGTVMHMLRSDDAHFKEFGEIYFSVTKPGMVKAWKIHTRTTLNYAVVSGNINLVLYDKRTDSVTRGKLISMSVGEDNYNLVQIPPGIAVGWKATGKKSAVLANCATEPHDPEECQNIEPAAGIIPHQW